MATTNTRTANRSPVTLKIKFKSETLNQFIERYSVDISHGGIFIRTKDPLPVGTALRFEFQLKDASPLITGDGTVVWTREFDPTRSGVAPGMGVRFDRLPSESQEILEQILAYKSAKLGGDNGSEVPAFLDVPTKVAQVGPNGQPVTGSTTPFGEVPTRVTPAHVLKSLQQGDDPRRTLIGIGMSQLKGTGQERSDDKTPLPRPLPFHADLDEFPDEAFEEATKVAEMEALAKKSAEEQGEVYGASMDDDVTMQRSKRPTAPAPEAMAAAVAATAMPDPADAARNKFSAVAAFDRAMREEEEEEGGFAHSSDQMAAASSAPAPAPQQEYRPAPAMATPMRDEVERDGGSSLPWIIAAAIVLVVASIGGFLLLNGKDDKAAEDQKAKQAAPVAQQDKQPTPTAAPTEPPPATPPAAPGLEAVVDSVPPGAMAELVGENQSGTTPMTFRGLEKGKKYTVKLSNAGFADKEMSFEAGGEAPKPVALVAKPVMLKVVSTPPGAAVFIDGQKQRGATPATIKLDSKLVAKKQLKLSVRRSGYNNADQDLALDGLVDGGDAMTQEVAVTLVRRAVVRPAGGGSKPGGGSSSGTATPTDGGTKPPDGAGAGDGTKPPDGAGTTPSDGAKPADSGSKPADGAKPADKPADKPAEKPPEKSGAAKPKEGAKAASSGEPTPEWSK